MTLFCMVSILFRADMIPDNLLTPAELCRPPREREEDGMSEGKKITSQKNDYTYKTSMVTVHTRISPTKTDCSASECTLGTTC